MPNPLFIDIVAIAERWAAASSDRAKLLVLADAVAHLVEPDLDDKILETEVAARKRALASWLAEQAVRL